MGIMPDGRTALLSRIRAGGPSTAESRHSSPPRGLKPPGSLHSHPPALLILPELPIDRTTAKVVKGPAVEDCLVVPITMLKTLLIHLVGERPRKLLTKPLYSVRAAIFANSGSAPARRVGLLSGLVKEGGSLEQPPSTAIPMV
jgi:hypothetical protein